MRIGSARRQHERVICILCPGSLEFAGGVGRCVSNLLRAMPQIDASIRYRFIDTRGSRHIALSPLFFLAAIARLTFLAGGRRIALVHANVSARGSTIRKFFVVLLMSVLEVPFVLHLHDGRFDSFYGKLPGIAQRLVRWMFNRADFTIVLGERWRRMLVEELGISREKVEVVCNGVPAPVPSTDAARAGLPVHLLFLGRFWDAKGVSDLLNALASKALGDLDWVVTLAGDGDSRPYQGQAARLGIEKRVRFLGWQDSDGVSSLLREATIFVLPSHVEGMPMVVLEAIAHRVPVVVTRVGSIPEFLVDGESALLVPPRDVDSLASALARLIRSPELRERLSTQGYELFRQRFDIAVIARRVAAIYRRVCEI